MTEREIFLTLLDLPDPAARGAYLNEVCAERAVRARIEALLAAHESSAGPLDRPAVRLVPSIDGGETPIRGDHTGEYAPTPDEARPPLGSTDTYHARLAAKTVIAGRYTLIEKIGEGGMGEVWVALQAKPFERKVALKLIKAGLDSRAVLTRFEAERQALARMDHPNIARVLDGGLTPTGQPFFVMELVNGQSLTRFCDAARMTPRERLALFVPICHAIQHAHQKGIVHRDLKPANILVTRIDGQPVPKVIDFGVAKAIAGKLTDDSPQTQFGSVVGTLEYMSPEQAGFSGQDIDTRADIYSLGVILYELLTGLRPLDSQRLRQAGFTEMIRIIQEEEPAKPSTRLSAEGTLPALAASRQTEPRRLTALLRGELDWVVMKCLEKQRDRRYETANALARDIQRYLADEPVEARPPSTSYRLRKFLRRNRGGVLAAGLVLLALVGGIAGTSYGLVVARREAAERERARQDEQEQRQLAEAANKQAYEALQSFTDELMGKVLGSRTTLTANERSILLEAQKQWEVFARSRGDSAEARVIRSAGAENLALVQSKLGMLTEAEVNHRLALEIRSALANDFPDVTRYRLLQGRGHQNLGSVLRSNGKSADAETQFAAAIEVFGRLVAEEPAEPEYRWRLAESHISLGNSCRDRGDFKRTEGQYTKALEHHRKLAAAYPDKTDYTWSLARSYWGLAFLNKRLDRPTVSAGYYRQAIALFEDLAGRQPTKGTYREDLGNLRRELGNVLADAGDRQAGLAEYAQAITIQTTLANDFPSMPQHRVALARTLRDHGKTLMRVGRLSEAEEQLQRSEALFEKLVKEQPQALPHQSDLGLTYCVHGDLRSKGETPESSLLYYDRAIRVLKAVLEQTPKAMLTQRSLAMTYANRAAVLDRLQRSGEAVADWDRALKGVTDDRRSAYRVGRAITLLRSGKTTEALAEVQEPLKSDPGSAGLWYDLARFFALADGKQLPDRAIELLHRAVRAGFDDAALLKNDTDLDALRPHEGFAKLLAEVEKRR